MSLTIKEYMKEHEGVASIKIPTLDNREGMIHIGFSEIHKHDIFYFFVNKEEIEGPYYFAYGRDYIERIIRGRLKPFFLPDKQIPEQLK